MDAAMQYSTAQFLVEGAGVNALLSTFLQFSWVAYIATLFFAAVSLILRRTAFGSTCR